MTPSSIVRVAPLSMPTAPVRVIGLADLLHVVSELTSPITSDDPLTQPIGAMLGRISTIRIVASNITNRFSFLFK